MDNLVYFILAAVAAEILGTIGGFGSSMFFVPIASYFLDFHSVLGITALFHVSSNISKIALFRKGFDKKLVISIGIPAVLFVIAGSFLSRYVETSVLELSLAVFLVTMSLLLLIFKNLAMTPTTPNAIASGMASGFVAGLLGTGGAIRGIALAAFNLRTDVFITTSAIIDLGIDLSRSFVYFSNGYMHRHDMYLVPILLVVSIIGTWVGKLILARMPEDRFRSAVLILVLATGVVTLVRAIATSTH